MLKEVDGVTELKKRTWVQYLKALTRSATTLFSCLLPVTCSIVVYGLVLFNVDQFSEIIRSNFFGEPRLATLALVYVFAALVIILSYDLITDTLSLQYKSYLWFRHDHVIDAIKTLPGVLGLAVILLTGFAPSFSEGVEEARCLMSRETTFTYAKSLIFIIFGCTRPSMWVFMLIGAIIVLMLCYFEIQVAQDRASRIRVVSAARSFSVGLLLPFLTLFFYIAMICILWDGTRLADEYGPIFILVSFLIFAMVLLFTINKASNKLSRSSGARSGGSRISIIVPYLSIIMLAGFFGFPAHHIVRSALPTPVASAKPIPITDAFIRWIKSRDVGNGKKIPIYLVAAEGGGLYAAYHSALILARLQDRIPNFSRNLFLISGVSGGGVGAAVFNASLKLSDEFPPPRLGGVSIHEKRMVDFFRRDFLTPVLAGTLYIDLPYQLSLLWLLAFWNESYLDRSYYLERTFLKSWDDVIFKATGRDVHSGGNFFRLPVDGYWSPEGNLPALAFSSTLVETGEPIIIAPLDLSFAGNSTPRRFELNTLNPEIVPTVAAAASLSARYPFLTPPAILKVANPAHWELPPQVYVGDGGYYDSSGLEVVRHVSQKLSRIIEREAALAEYRERIDIHVLFLAHRPSVRPAAQFYPELLTPYRAFSGAIEFRNLYNLDIMRGLNGKLWDIYLTSPEDRFNPPLAWHLSRRTKERIANRSGVSATGDCSGPHLLAGASREQIDKFCRFVRFVEESY